MSKLIQELIYDKVVEVLNLNTPGLVFDSGYSIALYENVPYVIDQSTASAFDYQREEVIPVSEEFSNETPSVNKADRADFIFQYQILFRTIHIDDVKTALNEFRDYFIANKQATIDDYSVSFKVTRGNKMPDIMLSSGNFWSRMNFTVYCTTIKNGYILKDTDIVEMVLKDHRDLTVTSGSLSIGKYYEIVTVGTTDWNVVFGTEDVEYAIGDKGTVVSVAIGNGTAKGAFQELSINVDTTGTNKNEVFSNASEVSKGNPELQTFSSNLKVFYNSTDLGKNIYRSIMAKIDKDTLYELKYTFDGIPLSYTVYISSGGRTLLPNGVVILDFNVSEIDV